MLYTRKGDDGTTRTYGCDQRISKSSAQAEALGAMDEINSYLGICKVKSTDKKLRVGKKGPLFKDIVHTIQQNLFNIQAELAGYPMKFGKEKVTAIEEIIDAIEKELPPIKTFFISGGTELGALFDTARTQARRAERRVIAVSEEKKVRLSKESLAYMNRLSSILYALARLSNHKAGIKENAPDYK